VLTSSALGCDSSIKPAQNNTCKAEMTLLGHPVANAIMKSR
jgi:hypothetical protein